MMLVLNGWMQRKRWSYEDAETEDGGRVLLALVAAVELPNDVDNIDDSSIGTTTGILYRYKNTISF